MSWFIVMALVLSRRVPSLERGGEFSGIGVVPTSPVRLLKEPPQREDAKIRNPRIIG
jgi:hypothetical protein